MPDYFSPDSVLVVTFGEDPENDKNAYQALTDLKQLLPQRARLGGVSGGVARRRIAAALGPVVLGLHL
jgi:hypothetical protein